MSAAVSITKFLYWPSAIVIACSDPLARVAARPATLPVSNADAGAAAAACAGLFCAEDRCTNRLRTLKQHSGPASSPRSRARQTLGSEGQMTLLDTVALTLEPLRSLCEAAGWLRDQQHSRRTPLVRPLRRSLYPSTPRTSAAQTPYARVVDFCSHSALIVAAADQPPPPPKGRSAAGPAARRSAAPRTPAAISPHRPIFLDTRVDPIAPVAVAAARVCRRFGLVREADTIALPDTEVIGLPAVIDAQAALAAPNGGAAVAREPWAADPNQQTRATAPAAVGLARRHTSRLKREMERRWCFSQPTPTMDYQQLTTGVADECL